MFQFPKHTSVILHLFDPKSRGSTISANIISSKSVSKDTRTISMTSIWCRCFKLSNKFNLFFCVLCFNVNLGNVLILMGRYYAHMHFILIRNDCWNYSRIDIILVTNQPFGLVFSSNAAVDSLDSFTSM